MADAIRGVETCSAAAQENRVKISSLLYHDVVPAGSFSESGFSVRTQTYTS
jgi:hypothetical protein